mmetsp:Transcript_17151/g.47868  ORF Transcript_17151/g.47868 Transcript_17151/m.47868 type:complete len:204 (+) Transcript_17151:284-895(+)
MTCKGALAALLVACAAGFCTLQQVAASTRGLGLKRHSKGNQQLSEGDSLPPYKTHSPAGQNSDAVRASTPLPPCALVVFIHVHKTGGTTIRDWVRDMQEGEWKQYSFHTDPHVTDDFCIGNNCVGGISKLVQLASKDPAMYAEVHGRVFIEDHGGVHDIRKSLREVQNLRSNSNFTSVGTCLDSDFLPLAVAGLHGTALQSHC